MEIDLFLMNENGASSGVGRAQMRWPIATTEHARAPAVGPDCGFFVVRHGFLLIIRGFVKVAVCNAGVIQQ
ncbi:hypothetical protein [Acidovorax sp.]|uniref:hypothetical protein n=1 Tax=Acidovorax sp. TaxID=1872122 RepID=UPI0026208A9E|nr:hypothetical protein [Acidovorax sp.]